MYICLGLSVVYYSLLLLGTVSNNDNSLVVVIIEVGPNCNLSCTSSAMNIILLSLYVQESDYICHILKKLSEFQTFDSSSLRYEE